MTTTAVLSARCCVLGAGCRVQGARCMVLVAWCIVFGGGVAFAQNDSLSAVRDLYASAAYEEALNVLGTMPSAPRSTDESRTMEQYRAFCLLALFRVLSIDASNALISGLLFCVQAEAC